MPRTTKAASTAYEQTRAERIHMLQQQMSGVLEASKELRTTVEKQKATKAVRKQRKPVQKLTMPARDASSRRSGRLAGQEAVAYSEAVLAAVDGGVLDSSTCVRATAAPLSGRWGTSGRKPEVYDDKHVTALGAATEEWDLFVDGYCQSTGKRVYDKVDGVTCHQCRQKTLGKRTSCSECCSLFGNFCGDCLYMRYGENINEVASNPAWTCPCCRDFCNCSFHRSRAGWAPTGTMYRAAQADGYVSVAHCLILNHLDPENLKQVVSGKLSVPGGYPEGWAKEHGAPFPPTAADAQAVAPNLAGAVAVASPAAVDAPAVEEEEAAASGGGSSQSSHSACTGEHLDVPHATDAATTDPNTTSATRKGKKPSQRKRNTAPSQNGGAGELAGSKLTRSSATGAAAVTALAVASPVRKATRAHARRSLSGKEIVQPALPLAAGGSVSAAWLSARH